MNPLGLAVLLFGLVFAFAARAAGGPAYGRTWIKPGKYPRAAAVADIAPTLSFLLEIRPPAASEGRVLEEILR